MMNISRFSVNKIFGRNMLPVLFLLLMLVVTFFSYFPSIFNGFTNWDDNKLLIENKNIRELSIENIRNIFNFTDLEEYRKNFGLKSLYIPVTEISFTIEYYFFRLHPMNYHMTNLVFHISNGFLVFWMIFLLSGSLITSFLTSIMFCIHPVHVESVAWVIERKDVLYSFFFLASIIFYFYFFTFRWKICYLLSLFSFILSILSKPMAITLPLILVLIEYYAKRRFEKSAILNTFPFFMISVISLIITNVTFAKMSQFGFNIDKSLTPVLNICNASYGFIFYLSKCVFPVKLSCLYPDLFTPGPGKTNELLPACLIFFILIASVIFLFSRYRSIIAFGSVFFFITLIPVIQLIPSIYGRTADRYTYIPYIGLFFILGDTIDRLLNSNKSSVKKIILPLTAILIITFSVLTWMQCKTWKNSLTLWNNVISIYPYEYTAYINRGTYFAENNDKLKAIDDFKRALIINPNDADTYNNLGNIYSSFNDYDKAVYYYSKSIELNKHNPLAYYNRGIAMITKGYYKAARDDFSLTIEIDPYIAQAYYYRGTCNEMIGKLEEAILDYSKSLVLEPRSKLAYLNRGLIYKTKSMFEKAILDFSKAIELEPQDILAYQYRGDAYEKDDLTKEALEDYKTLLRLDPLNADTYNNLGVFYYKRSSYENAHYFFTEAVRLNPKHMAAHFNRYLVYTKLNQKNKAIKEMNILHSLGFRKSKK